MRLLTGFFLSLMLLSFLGCDRANRESRTSDAAPQAELAKGSGGERSTPASRPALPNLASAPTAQERISSRGEGGGGGGGRNAGSITDDASAVSLASIGTVYAATESIDRKIIRNADLTLETESPTEGL